jgi:WD40 repeat protein
LISLIARDSTKISAYALKCEGKELKQFKEHDGVATSVVFSSDGKFAASVGDKTVHLWHLPGAGSAQDTPKPNR